MSYNSKFPLEQGGFCFLSNLKNYLHYYGLPVSEAWLGGIVGYMGFFYSSRPLATKEVIHGRSGDFPYLFQCLQQQMEKPLEQLEVKAEPGMMGRLGELLSKYNVMLVWINDFYLEYSPYYQLSDFWSLVVLLEVQDSKTIIFDNGLKELNSDAFMQAINCNGKGRLCFTGEDSLRWSGNEKAILLQGLRRMIARLEDGTEAGEEYYGICGMKRFAGDLNTCRNSGETYNLYFQMNRPGGLTLTRENMKKICTQMEEKGLLHEASECKSIYQDLVEYWRKIASLLFKLSNFEDSGLRDRIVKRVYDAIEYEERGLKALKALSDHLEGGK